MSYRVEVLDEVRLEDIPQLTERALRRRIAEILRELHVDPWLGAEMRERYNLRVLENCRKVSFDVRDKSGRERARKRYRLVYRNEPQDGAPAQILVLAIGERSALSAYRLAATRLGRRRRFVADRIANGPSLEEARRRYREEERLAEEAKEKRYRKKPPQN